MFLDLEKDKNNLGIINFGLDLTTMDDVFLKIGELDTAEEVGQDGVKMVLSKEVMSSTTRLVPRPLSGRDVRFIWLQVSGLFSDRSHYQKGRES